MLLFRTGLVDSSTGEGSCVGTPCRIFDSVMQCQELWVTAVHLAVVAHHDRRQEP